MSLRLKIFKTILSLMGAGLLTWIGLEIYRGNYLQAVAISGVSSILLWFVLGTGKPPPVDEP
jgi:hypothetical protein